MGNKLTLKRKRRKQSSSKSVESEKHGTLYAPSSDKVSRKTKIQESRYPYPTKDGRCGIFLIFNQENFDIPEIKRWGTNIDAERLRYVAESMGFDVHMHKDLTTSKIMEKLDNYAKMNHEDYSCFACGFLTYGKAGGFIRTFDSWLQLPKVFDKFRFNKASSSLKNKPKLFLIQACRGKRRIKPVSFRNGNRPSSSTEIVSREIIYSVEADFLVGHSTCPDYISTRYPWEDSLFINTFCDQVSMFDNKLNMMQILTEVNAQVALHVVECGSVSWMQMPQITTQLTADWYVKKPSPSNTVADQPRDYLLDQTGDKCLILSISPSTTKTATLLQNDRSRISQLAESLGYQVEDYVYTTKLDLMDKIKTNACHITEDHNPSSSHNGVPVPEHADFLIGWCSSGAHLNDPELGSRSLFVTSFCEVFHQHRDKETVIQLMARVNKKMVQSGEKFVCSVTSQLAKDVRFLAMPEENDNNRSVLDVDDEPGCSNGNN